MIFTSNSSAQSTKSSSKSISNPSNSSPVGLNILVLRILPVGTSTFFPTDPSNRNISSSASSMGPNGFGTIESTTSANECGSSVVDRWTISTISANESRLYGRVGNSFESGIGDLFSLNSFNSVGVCARDFADPGFPVADVVLVLIPPDSIALVESLGIVHLFSEALDCAELGPECFWRLDCTVLTILTLDSCLRCVRWLVNLNFPNQRCDCLHN